MARKARKTLATELTATNKKKAEHFLYLFSAK